MTDNKVQLKNDSLSNSFLEWALDVRLKEDREAIKREKLLDMFKLKLNSGGGGTLQETVNLGNEITDGTDMLNTVTDGNQTVTNTMSSHGNSLFGEDLSANLSATNESIYNADTIKVHSSDPDTSSQITTGSNDFVDPQYAKNVVWYENTSTDTTDSVELRTDKNGNHLITQRRESGALQGNNNLSVETDLQLKRDIEGKSYQLLGTDKTNTAHTIAELADYYDNVSSYNINTGSGFSNIGSDFIITGWDLGEAYYVCADIFKLGYGPGNTITDLRYTVFTADPSGRGRIGWYIKNELTGVTDVLQATTEVIMGNPPGTGSCNFTNNNFINSLGFIGVLYKTGSGNVEEQIEIGSESIHLNLNTDNDGSVGNRVTVDTPDGKEIIAYESNLLLPVVGPNRTPIVSGEITTTGNSAVIFPQYATPGPCILELRGGIQPAANGVSYVTIDQQGDDTYETFREVANGTDSGYNWVKHVVLPTWYLVNDALGITVDAPAGFWYSDKLSWSVLPLGKAGDQ